MPEEEGSAEFLGTADNCEKLSGWLNTRVEMLANGQITTEVYLNSLVRVASKADELAGRFFSSAHKVFFNLTALSPEAMEGQALATLSSGCRRDILEIVLDRERSKQSSK